MTIRHVIQVLRVLNKLKIEIISTSTVRSNDKQISGHFLRHQHPFSNIIKLVVFVLSYHKMHLVRQFVFFELFIFCHVLLRNHRLASRTTRYRYIWCVQFGSLNLELTSVWGLSWDGWDRILLGDDILLPVKLVNV